MSAAWRRYGKWAATVLLLLAGLIAWQQMRPKPVVVGTGGVQVSVPAGWQWNAAVTNAGGPIAIDNFNHAHSSGGVVPPGGAEIEITRGQPLEGTLGSIIREETAGTSEASTRELTAGGVDAVRVAHQDSFGPNLRYSVVTYYMVKNGMLYKFYLNHHAGDPKGPDFVQTFDRLVAGARIGQ